MKTFKKIAALMMALLTVVSLAACSSQRETTTAATEATTAAAETTTAAEPTGEATYTVGICQLVQHDALDLASQGFMDALTDELGDAVTFDYQNASNDATTCITICQTFVSNEYDLILANATPALQAAAAATDTIPILGTSITDYASALEISDWTGVTGTNISGTSDLAPLDQQAAMINELFPDAETVGILYCSAEANSLYQANTITPYLEEYGYDVEIHSFSDSNDVAAVTQTACDNCDVIYIPTDNTAASCTEAIQNVVEPAKIPVIAGESGICSGCGIATLSISYYDIGYAAGEMAVDILVGGADISTMPIETSSNVTKLYNAANVEAYGLTMPEGYSPIE